MIHIGDCLEVLKDIADNSIDSIVTDPPYGISFMAKRWDYDVPSVEVWRECMRVLKPGGHMLVACGTRTQHRMVVNIEDAGFEIRDVVTWLYGQGFPKALDISKATGSKDWEGWKTALKPACEFWTLARKPLSESTVAKNVLKWGTGGINVDGCRVATPDGKPAYNYANGPGENTFSVGNGVDGTRLEPVEASPLGRFPANLILDEHAAAMLDEQAPNCGAQAPVRKKATPKSTNTDNFKPHSFVGDGGASFRGDTGGASRFFYVAKASKSDRGQGNNHPCVKPTSLMVYLCRLITPPGGTVLDPFAGSGSTGVAAIREGFAFVGIEREPEYAEIAKARINAAS